MNLFVHIFEIGADVVVLAHKIVASNSQVMNPFVATAFVAAAMEEVAPHDAY